MSTISTLSVKIGADAEGFKRGMEEAQKAIGEAFDTNPVKALSGEIGNATSSVNKLIGNVKSLAGVMAGVFGAKELISGIVASGDAAYGLSQTLHLTSKQTALLSKTLQFTGGDANTLANAMLRLQKTYVSDGEASEKMRSVLAATGVQLTDTSGKFLDINDQLENLAKGYEIAKQAGLEEGYIMNTLGVRGMSLITTLEQYEEAKEAASKVVGVGLDPKEMHELSGALLELEMQSKQFGTACAMAFVPIAKEMIPPIMNEMQYWAGVIKENKDLIAGLTTEGIKLYAAYIAFSKVTTIFNAISATYKNIVTASQAATAAQITNEVRVTAAQEAQLQQQLRSTHSFYQQKINVATRAAARVQGVSQETAAKLMADVQALQAEEARVAATIRANWEANLAGVARAHQTMAAEGVAANERVAVASGQAAAAQLELGAAASTAGARTVTAMSVAEAGVVSLTRAVWALAAGWYGVAAAIGYAFYKSAQASQGRIDEAMSNTYTLSDGAVAEYVNGEWKKRNDGNAGQAVAEQATSGLADYENEDISEMDTENGITPTNNPDYFVSNQKTDSYSGLSDEQMADLNQQRYTAWSNTAQGKEEIAKAELEQQRAAMEDQMKALQDSLSTIQSDTDSGGSSSGAGSGGSAGKDLTEEIAKAQAKADEIAKGSLNDIAKYDRSEYENNIADVQDKKEKLLEELNELGEKGANIDIAVKAVNDAAIKEIEDITKKQKEANEKQAKEAELTWLHLEKKYAEYEDKRYQYALDSLEKNAALKKQEMMLTKDDLEGEAQYLMWYHAQRQQMEDEHLTKVKEVQEKIRQERLATTNIDYLLDYLDSEENLNEEYLNSQKELANTVKSIWKDSYMDMAKTQANLMKQMHSDLSSGLAGWVRGTKSASEAFSDFANGILDMMAQMIAKAIAYQTIMGIVGFVTGGGTSYQSYGEAKSAAMGYATGGYVSGPGSGTSDSIYAKLSNGEFIVNAEATKQNLPLLEAINSGMSAFADGGVVTAPEVRGVTNYSMNKPSASGNVNIKINLTNETGTEMKAETTGSQFDGESWVVGVVLNAVATNKNGMRSIIKGAATS